MEEKKNRQHWGEIMDSGQEIDRPLSRKEESIEEESSCFGNGMVR